MPALFKREGRLLVPPGTQSPVTPPCLTYDMACSSSCSSRTLLQTMGLWRHATTPRDLRCENYRISEGTSAEGIPNTSTISRDTANHVAQCTNNHDADDPDVHDRAQRRRRDGWSNTVIVGTLFHVKSMLIGERLSATSLQLAW